ncbi:helix-turn-helix domain-containing protein [Endozoicomonas sp. SESOKO1]|uniref:helix-turn-helix domain-containing protein n=1 Tax=Endozoicomonas sp. SESOKO1 TaxID=2828742 RepID=UPI002147E573|nr:helix-turn-helix domain-containing protein [Endozoicomonas sp. SESOKO1]
MATTTLEAFKKELNPAVVEQVEKQAFELLKEMTLADLRKHKGIRQEDLAAALSTKQPSISQIEKREDINLSTLVSYIRALGGELELVARFKDGERIPIAPVTRN